MAVATNFLTYFAKYPNFIQNINPLLRNVVKWLDTL